MLVTNENVPIHIRLDFGKLHRKYHEEKADWDTEAMLDLCCQSKLSYRKTGRLRCILTVSLRENV